MHPGRPALGRDIVEGGLAAHGWPASPFGHPQVDRLRVRQLPDWRTPPVRSSNCPFADGQLVDAELIHLEDVVLAAGAAVGLEIDDPETVGRIDLETVHRAGDQHLAAVQLQPQPKWDFHAQRMSVIAAGGPTVVAPKRGDRLIVLGLGVPRRPIGQLRPDLGQPLRQVRRQHSGLHRFGDQLMHQCAEDRAHILGRAAAGRSAEKPLPGAGQDRLHRAAGQPDRLGLGSDRKSGIAERPQAPPFARIRSAHQCRPCSSR